MRHVRLIAGLARHFYGHHAYQTPTAPQTTATAYNFAAHTQQLLSRPQGTFGNIPLPHPSVFFGPANRPGRSINRGSFLFSGATTVGPQSNFSNHVGGTAASRTTRGRTSSMSRFRRRRGRKRRTRSGLSFSFRNAGRLALSKVRKMERKIERKMFEIAVGGIADIGEPGTVHFLLTIAQGDGITNRSGNYVNPYMLYLNLRWIGVAASVNDVYRTIIFQDKRQVLSGTPAVSGGGGVLREPKVISLLAIENTKRFRILFDQTYTAPGDASVIQSWVLNLKIPLKGRVGWTTNVGTTINENGLYMINISNLATTNRPAIVYTARIMFTDT